MKDRIWICEECDKVFSEEEMREYRAFVVSVRKGEWGHPCKAHPRSKKPYRCESYLHKFVKDS